MPGSETDQPAMPGTGPASHPFPADLHPEGEMHSRGALDIETMHVEGVTISACSNMVIGGERVTTCACEGAKCMNCIRVAFTFRFKYQTPISAEDAASGLAEVHRVMSRPHLKAQMAGGINVGMVHDAWRNSLEKWRLLQNAGRFKRGSKLDRELTKLEELLNSSVRKTNRAKFAFDK